MKTMCWHYINLSSAEHMIKLGGKIRKEVRRNNSKNEDGGLELAKNAKRPSFTLVFMCRTKYKHLHSRVLRKVDIHFFLNLSIILITNVTVFFSKLICISMIQTRIKRTWVIHIESQETPSWTNFLSNGKRIFCAHPVWRLLAYTVFAD